MHGRQANGRIRVPCSEGDPDVLLHTPKNDISRLPFSRGKCIVVECPPFVIAIEFYRLTLSTSIEESYYRTPQRRSTAVIVWPSMLQRRLAFGVRRCDGATPFRERGHGGGCFVSSTARPSHGMSKCHSAGDGRKLLVATRLGRHAGGFSTSRDAP